MPNGLPPIAPDAFKKSIRQRIVQLRDATRPLLSDLSLDQIINIVTLIDESIENFSDYLGQSPALGVCSGLDLLRQYYGSLADYVDPESVEWDMPEEVDVLQLFAAYAVGCYSRAEALLTGRTGDRKSTVIGHDSTLALFLAADACMEASQALVFGYSELKQERGHLTDREEIVRRKKRFSLRGKKGGHGKGKRNASLVAEVMKHYEDLAAEHSEALKEAKAAKLILDRLYLSYEKGTYIDDAGNRTDLPTEKTVSNWLKRAKIKTAWEKIFAFADQLDAEAD